MTTAAMLHAIAMQLVISLLSMYPVLAEDTSSTPPDTIVEEGFVPLNDDDFASLAVSSFYTTDLGQTIPCSMLNIQYYHAFADNKGILGIKQSLGTVTPEQYKNAFVDPVIHQFYKPGQKTYWKPMSIGFPHREQYAEQLAYRARMANPNISDSKIEQVKETARDNFEAARAAFVAQNPEGIHAGWIRWYPTKIHEPLQISSAYAAELGLKLDVNTPYIVDDEVGKHDTFLQKFGYSVMDINRENRVSNAFKVKPIITVETVRKQSYPGTGTYGKEDPRLAFITYEQCSLPGFRRKSGSYHDLYVGEKDRIDQMIKEGSVFWFSSETNDLQPSTYNHDIDDAPVRLAYWNHLSGRLDSIEKQANRAELIRNALELPGYFVPVINSALSIRDFYHCKKSAEPYCMTALALDVASDFALFAKIPAVTAKLAEGAVKTAKTVNKLKKGAAIAEKAEITLTGLSDVIRKSASATEILAGAGNITLAALYAAEGDVFNSIARLLAGSSDIGFFLITNKTILFVPLKVDEKCITKSADAAEETLETTVKKVESNVDAYYATEPLCELDSAIIRVETDVTMGSVNRIMELSDRVWPGTSHIARDLAYEVNARAIERDFINALDNLSPGDLHYVRSVTGIQSPDGSVAAIGFSGVKEKGYLHFFENLHPALKDQVLKASKLNAEVLVEAGKKLDDKIAELRLKGVVGSDDELEFQAWEILAENGEEIRVDFAGGTALVSRRKWNLLNCSEIDALDKWLKADPTRQITDRKYLYSFDTIAKQSMKRCDNCKQTTNIPNTVVLSDKIKNVYLGPTSE